jgi:hypothetical protein
MGNRQDLLHRLGIAQVPVRSPSDTKHVDRFLKGAPGRLPEILIRLEFAEDFDQIRLHAIALTFFRPEPKPKRVIPVDMTGNTGLPAGLHLCRQPEGFIPADEAFGEHPALSKTGADQQEHHLPTVPPIADSRHLIGRR